jgi:polysaccharide biosynthesis/export protein
MRSPRAKPLRILAFLALPYLAGCATSSQNGQPSGTPALQNSNSLATQPSNAPILQHATSADNGDVQRLAELWLRRSREKANADFPIGVGDVVEISVPAIEELRSQTVRIAGDGTIALPFIGKLEAAGLTEEDLQQKLVERLKQYMYNPRVITFVKEYRSRQMAVLGAVMRPGIYGISASGDTVLDMISAAGGIAPGADPKLYFIPAEPAENGRMSQVAANLPQSVLQHDPAPLILKRTEPILIDVKQLSFGGNQQYLSLQVRPGDVIMVPGGGQILIEGWVEKPGAYPVTPGLTVAGAVIAAGGQLYPADVKAVKVIRPDRGGNKTVIIADLEKIKHGDAPDIPLQSGDIIDVAAQSSKLVPYGLYRFFSTVVNVGVGATVPIVR